MNVIKVSNIMGIDPKPFDRKTYVEEDSFVTDESGTKKRIRLEDNIVRWRTVKKADGTTSVSLMLFNDSTMKPISIKLSYGITTFHSLCFKELYNIFFLN
jgi:hypothetical protein